MLKLFIILCLSFIGEVAFAQQPQKEAVVFSNKSTVAHAPGRVTTTPLKLVSTIPSSIRKDTGIHSFLIRGEMGNEVPPDSVLLKTKDSLNQLKLKRQLVEPSPSTTPPSGQRSRPVDPTLIQTVGASFDAHLQGGGCPTDNSIAVSNGGDIVSVINYSICFYAPDGTLARYVTLNEFIGDSQESLCDPKVIYDPMEDRFVFLCINTDDNNSKVYLGFSTTASPLDGWNIYEVAGDPSGSGSFFDYPRIAVTRSDVIFTGNLYKGDAFQQSVIFQVEKQSGFNGAPLRFSSWKDLQNQPFTLVPLKYGLPEGTGNDIYLAASRTRGGNEIQIFHLTNSLDNNPSLDVFIFRTRAYLPPSNAFQPGVSTDSLLVTLDSRIMDGFFLNGTGHFVFHVNEDDRSVFRYYRIDLNRRTGQFVTVQDLSNEDFCYPSIVSYGRGPNDQAAFISFLASGKFRYPSIKAVLFNDRFVMSSPLMLKEGKESIRECWHDAFGGIRWGDYSGAARRYGTANPTVWVAGSYGGINGYWGSFLAEVFRGRRGGTPNNMANEGEPYFTISFDIEQKTSVLIELLDAWDGIVRELYRGPAYTGRNVFSFDPSSLPKAKYKVRVRTEPRVIAVDDVEIK